MDVDPPTQAPARSVPAPGVSHAPASAGEWVPSRRRSRVLWSGILLALTTIALYFPARRFSGVGCDDAEYLTSNPHVLQGLTFANSRWAFSSLDAGNWHPLTWLSLMLDASVFGGRVGGFHLTNILLHALASALVFFFLAELTGAVWRSAAVAAFFSWHPLHVESVAWISERKDVLSACFAFLTLLFYVRYARGQLIKSQLASGQPNSGASHSSFFVRHSSFSYGVSLFCFACGLMSKAMLVTCPLLMLLLDYWPLRRFNARPGWRLLLEKTPFFVCALAAGVVTFLAQLAGGGVVPAERLPMDARIENALVAYCRYLEKCFWPTDLAVLYPHPGYWPFVDVLLAALFLGTASLCFWLQRTRRGWLLAGWLWFLLTLLPVIGLVQAGEQSMADRYFYIPSVGLFICVVWGLAELSVPWRGRSLALPLLTAAAIAACLVLTRRQLEYWRNGETLFRHALSLSKDSATLHGNLGAALLDCGCRDEAIGELREAIRLQPDQAVAHNDLGVGLMRAGQMDEAIGELREAVRLSPARAAYHDNLGAALLGNGRLPEAANEFIVSATLDPSDANPPYELGVALAMHGDSAGAVSQYRKALRLNPELHEAHYNLGIALLEIGDVREALAELRAAVEFAPNYAPAHNALGAALARNGLYDEAVREVNEALRLRPDYGNAQTNLARILAAKNKSTGRGPAPAK